jgi:hypothetical protein
MGAGGVMEEPTLQQVIDGFRYGPLLGSIEDRANGIASYLTRGKVAVVVERIEGTVAHFAQQTMLENPMFHVRGGMGDFYRFDVSRFEIDMAPPNAD